MRPVAVECTAIGRKTEEFLEIVRCGKLSSGLSSGFLHGQLGFVLLFKLSESMYCKYLTCCKSQEYILVVCS